MKKKEKAKKSKTRLYIFLHYRQGVRFTGRYYMKISTQTNNNIAIINIIVIMNIKIVFLLFLLFFFPSTGVCERREKSFRKGSPSHHVGDHQHGRFCYYCEWCWCSWSSSSFSSSWSLLDWNDCSSRNLFFCFSAWTKLNISFNTSWTWLFPNF